MNSKEKTMSYQTITVAEQSEGVVLTVLQADLNDVTAVDFVRTELLEAAAAYPEQKIVLDLEQIDWLGGEGMALLLDFSNKMRATHTKWALAALSQYVKELLDITQTSRLFIIGNTVAEALELLSSDS